MGLVLLAAIGCEDPGSIALPDGALDRDAGPLGHGDDGGPPIDRDGGPVAVDAGDPCTADWECEDWDACTTDACVSAACTFTWIDACEGCRSSAECDDGDASTEDVCDTFTRSCSHFPVGPCGSAADCDDGNACTDDQCSPGTGLCAWGSVPDCCFRATDCDDGDGCTADACGTDHACVHDPIPGCGTSSCDYDHDGHGSDRCWPMGDDCNDFDPAVHGGATEICDNAIDDDCDGMRDLVDPACSSGNASCSGAIAITEPTTSTTGVTVSMPSGGGTTTSCGPSAFWSLALPETSDVTITVRIHDFAAEPPPCLGCPTPEPPMEIRYEAFLERTCGDPSTDVGGLTAGACYFWRPRGDGFFSGAREQTRTLRRVPAGAYSLEVQVGELFGWMARAYEFDLEVTIVPSATPECSAPIALSDGMTLSGGTAGHADAFGTDCSGTSLASPEAVHAFTLAERRRVRIAASGAIPEGSTYGPGVRLGLRGSCDPDAGRAACVDGTSGTAECGAAAILERILEPGTHYLTVEDRDAGTIDYSLTYRTESIGEACAGATAIPGSGSISGTTVGGGDRFRWNDAGCGAGAGPDVVHTLDVAVPSRVVLDLVASYEGAMLRLVRGCGEALVAGSRATTHVDTTLMPGRYEVVIGGTTSTSAGAYILNTTLVAM